MSGGEGHEGPALVFYSAVCKLPASSADTRTTLVGVIRPHKARSLGSCFSASWLSGRDTVHGSPAVLPCRHVVHLRSTLADTPLTLHPSARATVHDVVVPSASGGAASDADVAFATLVAAMQRVADANRDRSDGSGAVVVCDDGSSWSPGVAVAAVMAHTHWPLHRALFYVRAKWPTTYPSLPVFAALVRLADGDSRLGSGSGSGSGSSSGSDSGSGSDRSGRAGVTLAHLRALHVDSRGDVVLSRYRDVADVSADGDEGV